MKEHVKRTRYLLGKAERYAQAGNVLLRPYQEIAIQAVVNSVRRRRGMSFVWIFPRQSGKDEALALLVQYLLSLFSKEGAEMVFFNPTFKPQTETSMRRLEAHLNSNILTLGRWRRRSGYIFQLGNAYCTYLSADPTAHVVSATANRLLVVNEAQDVSLLKYDKDIDPMAASSNATRLFAGTRWTSDTLLEREYQLALKAQERDGLRRVFFFTAEDVISALPEYGKTVEAAIARLGRQHPLVKTQYFCETVDTQAGMFPPGRQALMQGSHAARTEREAEKTYAFLIDVAGQDEVRAGGYGLGEVGATHIVPVGYASPQRASTLQNPGRDSTNLKIVEVDMSGLEEMGKPTYLTVLRREWQGASHVAFFGALKSLVHSWQPMRIVIDATGVGEGLWSLLENTYGSNVVIPVKFTAQLKSQLGYGLIGLVESGRYREYHPFDERLRLQLDKVHSEILPGPAKLMRWGVPDGTRDERTGEPVHDDDLVTASMCTLLDRMEWRPYLPLGIIPGRDPLEEMDRNFQGFGIFDR